MGRADAASRDAGFLRAACECPKFEQSIRGRMVLNGLIVPTQAPWYPAFRAELLSFADLLGNQAVVRLRLIAQAACDRNDTLPRRNALRDMAARSC